MRRSLFPLVAAVIVAGGLIGARYVPGSPLAAPSGVAGGDLSQATPAATTPGPAAASADPTATPTPARTGPLLHPATVNISASGYWSWTLLEIKSGQLTGSNPANATSDTASMSKAWVAADYLRRAAEKNQQPSATIMAQLSTMIRDSDTTHTFEFHVANGNLSSIQRMVKLCGLTDTKGVQNSWSLTRMSARDVARLAACIADQRAAGPKWTSWLINEMRNVRGAGRFGIIEALPADAAKTTAIKNGWLLRDDQQWHISCMAIGDGWTLGVQARYAGSLGKDYGARICRDVTKQLLVQA